MPGGCGANATDYVDVEAVKAELLWARRLCNRRGWPVIDVTRRSIEETAATVLQLMEAWHARKRKAQQRPDGDPGGVASADAGEPVGGAGGACWPPPGCASRPGRPGWTRPRSRRRCGRRARTPAEAALTLAGLKAARVRDPDPVVIGADQILVCEGEWFDKPADRERPAPSLLRCAGGPHTLVTAVVCHRGGQEIWRHVARPSLRDAAVQRRVPGAYLRCGGRRGPRPASALTGWKGLGCTVRRGGGRACGDTGALPLLPLLGFLRQHWVLTL